MTLSDLRAEKMVRNFYRTLDSGVRVLLREKSISLETTVGELLTIVAVGKLLVVVEKEEVEED